MLDLIIFLKGFKYVYRSIYIMKKKNHTILVRITEKDKQMIEELREKRAINISSLIRKSIKEYYDKAKL